MEHKSHKQISSYEINMFTESLKNYLNIDFTEYANAFLRFRVMKFLERWGIKDLETLLLRLRSNTSLLDRFLLFMSVETTEMFRDPGFWRVFQKRVIHNSLIKKEQKINILVPFVTSDDELNTLLILLDKNDLIENSNIIATSPFEVNINRIKKYVYTEKQVALANENYKRFTQNTDTQLVNYFVQTDNNGFLFCPDLIEKVKFEVTDIVSNNFTAIESNFDLILFRNRMIYFNLNLQNRVLEHLFYHLENKGFLVIGFKENISSFIFLDRLKKIDKREKIFIKIK